MSQELHYTSVPRGLKPGSRGFCTVALTPHMTGPLVDRLEGLSGYQPVFSPDDPSAALNPIVFSHVRLKVTSGVLSVLSRIGPAGLDYSGRPNKYAHHVVLDGNERPEGGPAWLLTQPGFVQAAWAGEPREFPAGRVPPRGDRKPDVAHNWQTLTGDGGWAGVLAEAFQKDPKRSVFLAFQPGMDLLPLFAEAVALLPLSRRWEIEFSTYFSQLPQGITCTWRGVIEGSEEAKNARRLPNALFLDLCRQLGRAEGGALVHLARTGEQLRPQPGVSALPAEPARHPATTGRESNAEYSDAAVQAVAPRPRSRSGNYDLVPELARLTARGRSGSDDDRTDQVRRRRSPIIGALIAAGCIAPVVAIGLFYLAPGSMNMLRFGTHGDKDIADEIEKVSSAKRKAEAAKLEQAETEAAARRKSEEIAVAMVRRREKETHNPPAINPESTAPKTAHSPKPSIDIAVPKKSELIEPHLVFFKLPPVQISTLGGKPSEPSEIPLKNGISANAPRYYMRGFDLRLLENGEDYEIWAKTSSELTNPRIATLKAEPGKLHFKWAEQAKDLPNVAAKLRDEVVRIGGPEPEGYLFLRDPVLADRRAFDLSNKPGNKDFRLFLPDDYKPRNFEYPWADKEELADTNWHLGIRRWKLVSQRRDPGSGIVIAQGDDKNASHNVTLHIIPDEVVFGIHLDSAPNLHRVQVNLHFKQDNIIRKKNMRQKVLDKLERLQSTDARTKDQEKELQTLLQEKQNILHIKEIYDALWNSSHTNLSLIISLKLDDSTILDIAKFGEFANQEP